MTLSSSLVVGAEAVAEEELVAVERVREQGPGVGAALALVLARALVAQAWVPGLGQVRVKGDLDPVALKDRTAGALATEPAIAVLVPQTVQALAQATAPVRAGLDRAAAGTDADLLNLLKGSPHPAIYPKLGSGGVKGHLSQIALQDRPGRPDGPIGQNRKRGAPRVHP